MMQEFQAMERGEKGRGLLPREAPGGTRSPAVVGEEAHFLNHYKAGGCSPEHSPPCANSHLIVVVVVAIMVSAAANARIYVHRQELPALDEFRIQAGLVNLDIEQKPALAQDMFRIDEAGGFLVIGYEG